VEEHYKLDVTTTAFATGYRSEAVEEHYKLEVTTTQAHCCGLIKEVEEHYKLEVTTTILLQIERVIWWRNITN